jgi:hypothetical protein
LGTGIDFDLIERPNQDDKDTIRATCLFARLAKIAGVTPPIPTYSLSPSREHVAQTAVEDLLLVYT